MYSRKLSRRSFLKHTGTAAASVVGFPFVVSSSAMGMAGRAAPNSRINLGFVGVGGHGTAANLRPMLGQSDTQVIVVCDVDRERMQAAEKMVNAHYSGQNAAGSYKGCATTQDWRQVIARDDIDGVIVSTPDHWHVPISIAAVKAGRDVYCEKPLSLTVAEGRALSDVVKRHGSIFQTGSEFRGLYHFHHAAELVRNGRIGKLHTIYAWTGSGGATAEATPMPVPEGFDYDMWLGPARWAPYTKGRCHYHFRWIFDYSGGQLTDWGGHLVDQAQWANDTEHTGPVEIEGSGTFHEGSLYNTAKQFNVECKYANGIRLIVASRAQQPFNAGSVKYEGTDGWIYCSWFDSAFKAYPASVWDSVIGPDEVHLYTCRPGPERNWLDCIKTRRQAYYPAEVGHRSATVCHLCNIALLTGEKLKWDPQSEKFLNSDSANRMLSRSMRSPWHL